MVSTNESATSSSQINITILISGSGTNLQALIDALNTPSLPNARIIRVISNKRDAFGLTRASKASIPTTYHNLIAGGYTKRFPNTIAEPTSAPIKKPTSPSKEARESYDADLAKLILSESPQPDMIICAGWMHVLSPSFLSPIASANIPIINLHPALPGQYNGAGAIQRAFADFQQGKVDKTGVMVHYVIHEVDMGEPILTEEIPMKDGESIEKLEERIHKVEHGIIVRGAKKVVEALLEKKNRNQ